jgi:hypothetical protein
MLDPEYNINIINDTSLLSKVARIVYFPMLLRTEWVNGTENKFEAWEIYQN